MQDFCPWQEQLFSVGFCLAFLQYCSVYILVSNSVGGKAVINQQPASPIWVVMQHPTCWNRIRVGGYVYEPGVEDVTVQILLALLLGRELRRKNASRSNKQSHDAAFIYMLLVFFYWFCSRCACLFFVLVCTVNVNVPWGSSFGSPTTSWGQKALRLFLMTFVPKVHFILPRF